MRGHQAIRSAAITGRGGRCDDDGGGGGGGLDIAEEKGGGGGSCDRRDREEGSLGIIPQKVKRVRAKGRAGSTQQATKATSMSSSHTVL